MSRREAALDAAVRMKQARRATAAAPRAALAPPEPGPVSAPGPEPAVEEERAEAALTPPAGKSGITIDPAAVDRHVVCITDPAAPAAEQYKKIRAWVLRAAAANAFLTTVMITSPEAGEGKTLTALNLAVSLAQNLDTGVLLVDADLRNPSVHTYLGIPALRGLSDYLSGAAELPEVLLRTDIGNLSLLPGGTPPDNPSELLQSERMRLLVHELKHRYRDRYIVFDTSPVLSTAEPLSLGMHMDGVILLIRASQTSPKAAARAVKLMKGIPFLGAVYNNVPPSLGESIYTYRYADSRTAEGGGSACLAAPRNGNGRHP